MDTDVFLDIEKGGYECGTEHKTLRAQNTDRKTVREESTHTRHRIKKKGKPTRKMREGDRGYYF